MNNYILYTYDATGQKLKKTVNKGKSTTTTDYMNGFQYINDELAFFATAEGYVKHTKAGGESLYNYVYHYTDHLGNIRLAYTKDPVSGEPKIIEENNYYPFGLKHPYNAAIYEFTANGSGVSLQQVNEKAYDYKYQGQELQDELGLNWYSFKYRNYMPDIGRFFNVDPLAEDYSYQTPYAFSGNKVVSHRELEGLEEVIAIYGTGQNPVVHKMSNYHLKDWNRLKLTYSNYLTNTSSSWHTGRDAYYRYSNENNIVTPGNGLLTIDLSGNNSTASYANVNYNMSPKPYTTKESLQTFGHYSKEAVPDAGEFNVQFSVYAPKLLDHGIPANRFNFGLSKVHADDGWATFVNFGFEFSTDISKFSVTGNVNAFYKVGGGEILLSEMLGKEFNFSVDTPTPWDFNLGVNYINMPDVNVKGGGLNVSPIGAPSGSVGVNYSFNLTEALDKFNRN